jgi:hypothetical protein
MNDWLPLGILIGALMGKFLCRFGRPKICPHFWAMGKAQQQAQQNCMYDLGIDSLK